MALIDIKGLDKAEVLLALWNASKMQGMSFLGYSRPMTLEYAQECIKRVHCTGRDGEEHIYFDYLNGKVMKVDLGEDEFDPRLYDRDNGDGAAKAAIDNLKLSKCFNEYGEAKASDIMKVMKSEEQKSGNCPIVKF